ncbi:hypothetical protein M378DRAFT_170711 [Amanita muscaria Koide BX008]|uniref:FAD-binding PCMH-type domain-containing protein n=1 Tax=Amanita muscaria (strain Koide BX008) TaxID=946122 RepID=A0A0C2S6I5_AMAMK|nr:hypothetical protein M378DRAFT_170711 [Amanita muscaria Koide BX008]
MLGGLTLLLSVASAAYGNLIPQLDGYNSSFAHVCDLISSSISQESSVHYLGTAAYQKDIYHWASSSTQHSACTVEPGSVRDVANVLQIVGQTQTPFAVKSGGHSTNPNFSSSPGVLIALYQFNEIKFDPASQTVSFGTGLIWDDVYAALAPYNVSVLGARVTGLGVGFVLGGGYAWKSNQYGLALDTITAFELVKPDGSVVTVTEESDSELFFGLKGGYNNFGVVTRITMQTFPQTNVWGGPLTYPATSMSAVTAAVIKFSATNTDPKANIAASYDCFAAIPFSIVFLYYDAPSPPQGLFDDFFKIPIHQSNVGERSLLDYIKLPPAGNSTANIRSAFNTVPILRYTEGLMRVIEEENLKWCVKELAATGPFVTYTAEPFLPTILGHSTLSSAYPPTRDMVFSPFLIYFAWLDGALDNQVFNNIKESAARIRQAVIEDGQNITGAPKYPNYALFDTPVDEIYGGNVNRLKALRSRVDPSNVMGLAGGFRF